VREANGRGSRRSGARGQAIKRKSERAGRRRIYAWAAKERRKENRRESYRRRRRRRFRFGRWTAGAARAFGGGCGVGGGGDVTHRWVGSTGLRHTPLALRKAHRTV